MDTREAKDFLVQQTTEQAALEGVTLSDLEKRMMYFTESDPASCADPIGLNKEFEAQYDTSEYEAKIAGLLRRAHKRLKPEDPQNAQKWEQAMRELRRGDHYLLVMSGRSSALLAPTSTAGRRVIQFGSVAVALFFCFGILVTRFPNLPTWVLGGLGVLLVCSLGVAVVFLIKQGVEALRRKS